MTLDPLAPLRLPQQVIGLGPAVAHLALQPSLRLEVRLRRGGGEPLAGLGVVAQPQRQLADEVSPQHTLLAGVAAGERLLVVLAGLLQPDLLGLGVVAPTLDP